MTELSKKTVPLLWLEKSLRSEAIFGFIASISIYMIWSQFQEISLLTIMGIYFIFSSTAYILIPMFFLQTSPYGLLTGKSEHD